MSTELTQAKGSTSRYTSRKSCAIEFNTKIDEVQYISVGLDTSTIKVFIDNNTQIPYVGNFINGNVISWVSDPVKCILTTSSGTYTLFSYGLTKNIPNLLDYDSDSATDDSTRFKKAILAGTESLYIPPREIYKDVMIGELDITSTLRLWGDSGSNINTGGSTIKKIASASYGIHFNGTGQTTRPMGGGLFNLQVRGESSTDTGPLIKVTSWSYMRINNCAIQNISDWGIIARDMMESSCEYTLFRRIGSDTTGILLMDDYIGTPNSNVNNFHFSNNTLGYSSGNWIKSSTNSNPDLIWIERNKFEWDGTPTSANITPKAVIDFGQMSRCRITNNGFTHFTTDHNNYEGILRMRSGCAYLTKLIDNDALSCSGYFGSVEGGKLQASGNFYNRGVVASGNMQFNVTSTRPQSIEPVICFTSNGNITSVGDYIDPNFISAHNMFGTSNNMFQTDTMASLYTTMNVPSLVEIRRFQLGKQYLDSNTVLTIQARVKCVDTAGTNGELKLNIDGTTDIGSSTITASTGWQLITFQLKPSQIGAGSLRFINSGTVSILFDGIYIQRSKYIDWNFAFNPGAIAAGASITSALQSYTDTIGVTGLIQSFSQPKFDGNINGLLCSVVSNNINGSFYVTLYNPTASPITPTITRCYIRLFLI
ncbi:tailspike protein [Klebsiella phage K64-1]|uniref:Depolymerase, capsule K21-specific n=1 Tax=Klebsiella phage K64-1 TaxID=1439894 RepID=DPO13_BPK64|nr:tail spike protein [Klebsiella phage K64-1]A0A0A8J8S8.1 RecName: Full=Depolymerase, capsule K21-specific; AltName: Full=Probable tail spike protein [Klebsiella phage K64-1]BAQ02836.1 tailspike protein [Klebsiella phage K64-1]BAW85693.1 tail spike protein [Klebsiella phage K64-1]